MADLTDLGERVFLATWRAVKFARRNEVVHDVPDGRDMLRGRKRFVRRPPDVDTIVLLKRALELSSPPSSALARLPITPLRFK